MTVNIGLDILKLNTNIDACKTTVESYEQAIVDERKRQEELRHLVEHPGEYSVAALKRNVTDCDRNIGHFEAAISKEQAKIAQLRHMIEVLEEKRDNQERCHD